MILVFAFVIIALAIVVFGVMNPAKPNKEAKIGKRFLWTIPDVLVVLIVLLIIAVAITILGENWFT